MKGARLLGALLVLLTAGPVLYFIFQQNTFLTLSYLLRSSTPQLSIGLVSLWCGTRANPYERHHLTRKCYAEMHSYEYILENDCEAVQRMGLITIYGKVTAMQKHLHRFDALMWVDGDVMVTNYTIKLEPILHRYPKSSLIVPSYYPREMGQPFGSWTFIMRNTSWSRRFLEDWMVLGQQYRDCTSDQSTLLLNIVLALLRSPVIRIPPAFGNGSCASHMPNPCIKWLGETVWWCFREDLAALGVVEKWSHDETAHDLVVAQIPFSWDSGMQLMFTAGYVEPHTPDLMGRSFLAHVKASGPHHDVAYKSAWPLPCLPQQGTNKSESDVRWTKR